MSEEEFNKKNQKDLDNAWEDYTYGIKKFDEQSLLISSGALGLSLSFIKDIVPIKESSCIILFYFSILLFLTTIIVGFLSHRESAKTNRFICDKIVDRSKLKEDNEAEIRRIEKEIKDYQLSRRKIIANMNNVTTYSLIIGLFLLVVYCIINIFIYKSSC